MESQPPDSDMNFFRAPAAARMAKILDRSLFTNTLQAALACPRDNKLLSKYRKELEKTGEVLLLHRLDYVKPNPDPAQAALGKKALVLQPKVNADDPSTWSTILKEASENGDIKVVPHQLQVGYESWTYSEIMRSILPEELMDEIPSGFNTVGHVAHLNLREQYLPYKRVIAEVILDKNAHLRTVINKLDNVGDENEYRTFAYEVLAGPDDMHVQVSESNCTFQFDYSKVYWNTKLSTEHQRIIDMFKPGEVVADVMAGIGPFAVPAGKHGVFVWANDKNPESFKYLAEATKKNKVQQFVRPFNEDGHGFIRQAADSVLAASKKGDHALVQTVKVSRNAPGPRPKPTKVPIPPTISHFVMNLPASAIEFLHNFKGLYQGQEVLFEPRTDTKLPIVHVHCFALKSDDDVPLDDICNRIHSEIGVMLKPGHVDRPGEVAIHEVRDVAPAKRMFCASFRLPAEVAFASRS